MSRKRRIFEVVGIHCFDHPPLLSSALLGESARLRRVAEETIKGGEIMKESPNQGRRNKMLPQKV